LMMFYNFSCVAHVANPSGEKMPLNMLYDVFLTSQSPQKIKNVIHDPDVFIQGTSPDPDRKGKPVLLSTIVIIRTFHNLLA
jgi:hypothetical protein